MLTAECEIIICCLRRVSKLYFIWRKNLEAPYVLYVGGRVVQKTGKWLAKGRAYFFDLFILYFLHQQSKLDVYDPRRIAMFKVGPDLLL